MKTAFRRRVILSALALVSLCAAAALPNAAVERGPQRRTSAFPAETEARVIVKYKADSALMRAQSVSAQPPQHAQALSARLGLNLTDGRATGPRSQVLKTSGMSSQQLADSLSAQSDVEYAVIDGRMHALAAPSDPLYAAGQTTVTPAAGQWYLRAPTSSTIASSSSIVSSINVENAWGITTGSSSVVVADLDTGVRFDHPDLTAKLLAGYDFISTTTVSNDGDSRDSDATDPGDYGCGETTSSWHGTQTAGLIGASTNNGIGMASVGRDVMVLPVRVLGCGGGYDSDIQAAMLWAAGISVSGVPTNTHPAKVLNLSLGATGACSSAYADTIAQVNAAGAVVVVSAGNEGLDVGTPANCAGAIAVAGVRHSGTKVGYSDLGSKIAIAAPAGNCVSATGTCLYPIVTTSNSGATTPMASTYTSGGADASLGTSFSAPLVSGTAALMFSANPSLTPAQVLSALKSSARSFPSSGAGSGISACTAPTSLTDTSTAQTSECYCTTSTCGAGLLDAGAAVAQVAAGLPVANIDTATIVLAGSTLSLSGAASKASTTSAAIQTYAWSIVSGGSIATFSGATNASTATLVGSAVGTVVVTLTVSDTSGKTATTSTTLTVVTPTAAVITPSAGSVVAGGSISLDGTGSHAKLGNIVGYQWAVTDGASVASLSGATNGSTATLLTTAAGNVTVTLTVTDALGQTATASQALAVTAVPSSSGGGAMDLGWLLGWLASVIGVWIVTPRRAQRPC
jgi:serine protease